MGSSTLGRLAVLLAVLLGIAASQNASDTTATSHNDTLVRHGRSLDGDDNATDTGSTTNDTNNLMTEAEGQPTDDGSDVVALMPPGGAGVTEDTSDSSAPAQSEGAESESSSSGQAVGDENPAPSDEPVDDGQGTQSASGETSESETGSEGNGSGETGETADTGSEEANENHVSVRPHELCSVPIEDMLAENCGNEGNSRHTKCKRMDKQCVHKVKCITVQDTDLCQVYCETLQHLYLTAESGLTYNSTFRFVRIALKDENNGAIEKKIVYNFDGHALFNIVNSQTEMRQHVHGLIVYARVCYDNE